ncbi:MAG: trypsin-like peptidase domain-containing protein [Blastocatellia bacterium]
MCATVVGITALVLVAASFTRPRAFQSFFMGQRESAAGGRAADLSSNAEIVERANHGVVTVVAVRSLKPGEKAAGAPVGRNEGNVQRGTGTGFIIDEAGLIVTNEHVIKDAERIRVKLADGRELTAAVIGSDRATDLALLKIDAPDLFPLALGDSGDMRVGDPVIAIGNPVEYERTVTAGIISALGRKVYGKEPFEDFIQTDAAINRGNSGGPLLNRLGEVIGVNTVIRIDASGISFAVPSNVVNRVVAQLRAFGQVSRGYLGLTPVGLTPEFREGLGLGDLQGVLVADVAPDLPAARAGIQPYDVVTHFDSRPIRHTNDFFTLVANTPPRQQVELAVIRNGQRLTLRATLDQRPVREEISDAEARPVIEKMNRQPEPTLGFTVRENTPQVLREMRLGKLDETIAGGVVVSEVDPLGPAADSRLAVGHIIVEANRQPIHTLEDFQKMISQLHPGSVIVIRYTPPNQRSLSMAAIRVGRG